MINRLHQLTRNRINPYSTLAGKIPKLYLPGTPAGVECVLAFKSSCRKIGIRDNLDPVQIIFCSYRINVRRNRSKLINILLYHVVSGEVMAETAITLDSAKTLQGSSISINLDGKTLKIDGASVTQADIKASNGVIHVIDSVILPKS